MTDFETAARKAAKAAFDVIRHIIAEHPDLFEKTNETHWAARDVLEIEITKHFEELAEVQGKLVELAKAYNEQKIYREVFISFGELVTANSSKTGIAINGEIASLLADPQVAALIERKRE